MIYERRLKNVSAEVFLYSLIVYFCKHFSKYD